MQDGFRFDSIADPPLKIVISYKTPCWSDGDTDRMVPLLSAFILFQAPDIKSTIDTFVNAVIRYDVAILERITDPQYVEVSPLGQVDEREKFLSFYRVPADKRGPGPSKVELTDWLIRPIGKSGSVAIFRETLEIGGRKISFRVTTVLQMKGSGWVVVSNHATALRG